MTIEEAIERFRGLNIGRESFSEEYGEEIFCGDAEAHEMGVKALEKQMPKKPSNSDSGMFCICPTCNHFIDKHEAAHGDIKIPFCKWRGQSLDWDKQSDGG